MAHAQPPPPPEVAATAVRVQAADAARAAAHAAELDALEDMITEREEDHLEASFLPPTGQHALDDCCYE